MAQNTSLHSLSNFNTPQDKGYLSGGSNPSPAGIPYDFQRVLEAYLRLALLKDMGWDYPVKPIKEESDERPGS